MKNKTPQTPESRLRVVSPESKISINELDKGVIGIITHESRSDTDLNLLPITKYIHGYTTEEQDRLLRQSHFLESYIYTNINFSNCDHIMLLPRHIPQCISEAHLIEDP